jgi:hypothetical protein
LAESVPARGVVAVKRGLGLLGLFMVAALIGGTASAAPIIIRDTITTPFSETGLTHDCRPGLTGTFVGTDVLSFQSVETPQGFHFMGTFTDTGRIDWSDGSYTLIESVDTTSFNAVGPGTTVFTNAHTDAGDFFSPSGEFEFRDTFHLIEHITVTNGDVTRVEFEMGHFHFFGDC